jgi:hypothetical protein
LPSNVKRNLSGSPPEEIGTAPFRDRYRRNSVQVRAAAE